MTKDFLLSIVIPVYNEEQNIKPLLQNLLPIIKPYRHEVIFVDDGSNDKTVIIIKKEAEKSQNIKLIVFQRNFGHQMALTAGYQNASGDCVITLDADLQDPPNIIPQMIDKWQKGTKIVYAKRERRDVDSSFKRLTAQLFYKYINFLSDSPIPEEVGDYRLIDKSVVEFFNSLPEHSRFLRGLTAWGGFSADYVFFKREKRFAGETHYTVSR